VCACWLKNSPGARRLLDRLLDKYTTEGKGGKLVRDDAAIVRKLVPDELAAAFGEDGRTAGQACPVLLVAAGGKPFNETFICQHAGADRWTAASVGIAQAATPKETILISPRNGEVSEKAGSGSRGDGVLGLGKGWLGASGTIWQKA